MHVANERINTNYQILSMPPQVHLQIPNKQVKVIADEYFDASKKIFELLCAVMPMLHCGVLAIELHMRSLVARPIETHDLVELFNALEPKVRREVSSAYSDAFRGEDLKSALVDLDSTFLFSRYPYEPKAVIPDGCVTSIRALSVFFATFVECMSSRRVIVTWENELSSPE